jgi:hypothetical protein
MAIFGIGLHVLVAIFFAVHAIRSGQQLYWVVILFMFPLLGSIVYFAAIYLPDSRLQHGARKAVSAAARTLDPGRELREAREAYDFTPTAQNQMRLASALLAGGQPEEAASTYEACLNGPFANDLEIRLGAARATLASSRPAAAVAHLQAIRAADAGFRPEQVALLLAQALAGAGRHDEARASSNRRWAASTVLPCRRNMRSGRPAWAMPTRPTSCMATCSAPWSAGHAIRAT